MFRYPSHNLHNASIFSFEIYPIVEHDSYADDDDYQTDIKKYKSAAGLAGTGASAVDAETGRKRSIQKRQRFLQDQVNEVHLYFEKMKINKAPLGLTLSFRKQNPLASSENFKNPLLPINTTTTSTGSTLSRSSADYRLRCRNCRMSKHRRSRNFALVETEFASILKQVGNTTAITAADDDNNKQQQQQQLEVSPLKSKFGIDGYRI